MTENASVLFALCSHLEANEQRNPLEPREWSALAGQLAAHGMQLKQLPSLSKNEFVDIFGPDNSMYDRIMNLLARETNVLFALNQLRGAGIEVVTSEDEEYPRRLRRALGHSCPPLFYYAGNLQLLEQPAIGYAGSRSVSDAEVRLTADTVKKTVQHGCIVVSGGAKGVDSAAETAALELDSAAISFLSDSLLRKIKVPQYLRALREGKMLLLSAVNPDAGFSAGFAMMRNRYIYLQSRAVVVIRSDYQKGGTWAGAAESLKHPWSPVLCYNQPDAPGNQALLRQGAIPIDAAWNGDLDQLLAARKLEQTEQLTMF